MILGGDDLTDHGSVDAGGNPLDGWLYIQRALENVSPLVTRANDGTVAALGASASAATSGDAGAAIGVAASSAGMGVSYHDGADAINAFFAAVNAGTANPRIIWISGTGALNDLDGADNDLADPEIDAVNANATSIAAFVNAGGGLISHGSAYGWLSGLLPGLMVVPSGADGDLSLTASGTAAFPGVTNDDINAGPWHDHFAGDFGGLQVLATSGTIDDAAGNDAAVIIGGTGVILPSAITLTPQSATNTTGASHTVTATVRSAGGALLAGAVVTFEVTAGPNLGVTGTDTTDASGQATFTYAGGANVGTDAIRATFTDELGIVRTATVAKSWVAPPSLPDTATSS